MAVVGTALWFLAGAYVFVSVASLVASRTGGRRREGSLWMVMSAALMLLGAAKLLQLQGRITDWLRTSAKQHHLYGERAVAQYLLVLILLAAISIFARPLWHWLRNMNRSVTTAAITMAALLAFILVRAASIHALDPAMTFQVAGLRSGWWVELTGLLLIAAAACKFISEQRR